jgi:hypothetical protein
MLSLNVRTKIKPEEVVKKAVQFFGPAGYKLKVIQQGISSAEFEGGGGGVRVIAYTDDKGTSVDLETREWDYQVKEFADVLK